MSEFPLLSDEQVDDIWNGAAAGCVMQMNNNAEVTMARAIEAASRAPLLAEIDRLSAEVERNVQSRKESQIQNEALKGEVSRLQGLAKHCDYLRSEVERLKADAERYQFLRDDFSPMGVNIDGNHAWAYRRNFSLKGPNLDEAIDAARAQGGE